MAYLVYQKGNSSTVQFVIAAPGIVVGRLKENEVSIDDSLVSKQHFRIDVVENPEKPGDAEFFIEDLNSTNHTFVNDIKITRKKLRHNDVIRVGITHLRFIEYEGEHYESTAVMKKSWIPGVYYTESKTEKAKKTTAKKSKK